MRNLFKRLGFAVLICCCFAKASGQLNTDSLNALLQNASDREKLSILQSIGISLGNKPYEALEYINQATEIAVRLNDDEAAARCYQLAGKYHYQSSNFAKAKESYGKALQYFGKTRNERAEAEVNSSLASLHFAQGNLPAAAEGYLNALRYYEHSDSKAGLVGALSNLGNIYLKQNNFSKAIEYHERAIKIYEESSDKFRTLVGADQIGNIYLQQNNLRKASEYFNKSLRLNREINNPTGIAYTLHQLGKIAERSGDAKSAIAYFRQSIRISESLKTQPVLTVGNLNGLAKAYADTKAYDEAVSHYQRAIRMAKSLGLKFELELAYTGLSDVYQQTRESSKAQRFQKLSTNIRDSLYNDSIYKLLSDKELVYQAERKQTQIELMSKEQKIKDSELLRERQLRNMFTIASVILGVVFLVLVLFFIHNKRIATRLQKQKNELQVKNVEIIAQSEQLRQLNTVKDRFFSIISHDLRNNLTTMRLYFDLISNPEYVPTENKELTSQIAGSVENTIDLLENLLVWASAQIKGVPMHIQRINLHSLSEENIQLLSWNARQKEITLTNHIPEDTTAYGDLDMIRLVMRNLISNATKFTPVNGHIDVHAEIRGGVCRTWVRDNGVGISKASMERLFSQHENPTTKGTGNEKGTGLGLILCKDFIERNFGKIWAESEEGKGSSFIFELPVSPRPEH